MRCLHGAAASGQNPVPACVDPASPCPDLPNPCLELAARGRLVVACRSGGAGCGLATLAGRRSRREVAVAWMLHDGGLEATFNAASAGAGALAVLGYHGVTEAACVVLGHDNHGWPCDLLWAWLSICNGSMSSAQKLCVVADGEQLHLASQKMLRLAACNSLWPHAVVLTGLADVRWCGPFVQVCGGACWAKTRPVLVGANDGDTSGAFLGSVVEASPHPAGFF